MKNIEKRKDEDDLNQSGLRRQGKVRHRRTQTGGRR